MLKYFTFGNIHFPAYNLMIGIGIALAMLYLQYNKEFIAKSEQHKHNLHVCLLVSVLLGFAGAYLFDAYTQGVPLSLDNLSSIGLTFFSGLITGMLLLIIMLRLYSFPIISTLNMLTPAFLIAHFFGRIGCFFAGCCFGHKTNSPFGVIFPEGSLPHYHYNELVPIHPTQLYESFFVLCIFIVLRLFKIKNTFAVYLMMYSVFRFLLEFLRADDRGAALGQNLFTPSQLLSMGTFITVLAVSVLFKITRIGYINPNR